MRALDVLLLPVFVLVGCSAPKEIEPAPLVLSGNPVRDGYAADMRDLQLSRAHKDEVLKKIGGQATKVPDASYFSALPHSGFSTLTIPPETVAEWSKQFSESAETYHVLGEGGNDFILFFGSDGRLRDYFHF